MPNYVEPFAGSLAVLLGRPHPPRIETVNDKDCMLANFWRAIQAAPEEVAAWADWPVNEADLHARHLALVRQLPEMTERMKTNPDYFDVKVAGWWVWGISQWIGSGWCSRPEWAGRGNGSRAPRGIHAKRPQLGRGSKGDVGEIGERLAIQTGAGSGSRGVHRKMPDCHTFRGVSAKSVRGIEEWFVAIANRLRRVRVCCGDWSRIMGPSPTWKIGLTGVFLDPPYSDDADRGEVYGVDDMRVAHDVREWAIANGNNPLLRIALCGYEGEHKMPKSWDCVAWKAAGRVRIARRWTRPRECWQRENLA